MFSGGLLSLLLIHSEDAKSFIERKLPHQNAVDNLKLQVYFNPQHGRENENPAVQLAVQDDVPESLLHLRQESPGGKWTVPEVLSAAYGVASRIPTH